MDIMCHWNIEITRVHKSVIANMVIIGFYSVLVVTSSLGAVDDAAALVSTDSVVVGFSSSNIVFCGILSLFESCVFRAGLTSLAGLSLQSLLAVAEGFLGLSVAYRGRSSQFFSIAFTLRLFGINNAIADRFLHRFSGCRSSFGCCSGN